VVLHQESPQNLKQLLAVIVQDLRDPLVGIHQLVMRGIIEILVQVAVVLVLQNGLLMQQMTHHVMGIHVRQESIAQEALVYQIVPRMHHIPVIIMMSIIMTHVET
jgi:hypothetical protein